MASVSIVKIWCYTAPFHTDSLEGMLDVFLFRKRLVLMLDGGRFEINVFKYDEGTAWSHSIGMQQIFLNRPRLLQTFLESSLADLNVDAISQQNITQGIMSFIYGMVGRHILNFYVGVDLEIVQVVDEQSLDVGVLFEQSGHISKKQQSTNLVEHQQKFYRN